jgi:hypothetical protein
MPGPGLSEGPENYTVEDAIQFASLTRMSNYVLCMPFSAHSHWESLTTLRFDCLSTRVRGNYLARRRGCPSVDPELAASEIALHAQSLRHSHCFGVRAIPAHG